MITRKKYLPIILTISLMLIVSATSWAETIRLKNGRIFDGIVADESGGEVKIVMKSGMVTFSRDEIDSIGDRKISEEDLKEAVRSLSAPAPVKKPVVKKSVKSAAVTSLPAPKKEQKAVAQVKKQVTQDKAAQPANLPTVATGTTTFTQFAPSTATVASTASTQLTPPNPLPVKSKRGSPLNGNSEIIIIVIVIIAIVIVLITKRIKKQPKDIE